MNATDTTLRVGDLELEADWARWSWGELAAFWAVVVIGQELLFFVLEAFDRATSKRIPYSGKSLEVLGWKDWAFVYFNRLSVPLMTYHMFWYAFSSGDITWKVEDIGLLNTLGAVVAYYIVYDLFYVPFHAFLHVRAVYPWVHKHHHRQAAPSRGNTDASNTHPIEFVLGEYLHLVAVAVVAQIFTPHVISIPIFVLVGGVMASLNHTRMDLEIPHFFDTKAHDLHHCIPTCNYGQYIMLFDKAYGTFRASHKPAEEKKVN
ncbi:Methylsterol monooxygenase 1 [Hondaea fermentalgiana]|uniref:Methylsterol monooxygenase 1 n=1 Tax=Hondaea fermentalgiana TaxID=2315210 RepID=A0A2R5G8S5_9STRA|nr:Methylsterol monooxygenase 1 [Hondaea fermentalgiana]|eukprot:GBG26945.1 Methylsterol monooxygenase 1 [Hondaea fermentalgiana]